jgi:alkyl sulfatase BDS1-like metallo-beta-lactamase superfamily hydrolase
MKTRIVLFFLFLTMTCAGCEKEMPNDPDADAQGHTAPTSVTVALNKKVLEELPFSDRQAFEDNMRGLIASDPDLRVKNSRGEIIWDQPSYAFIDGDAPGSVNPSLWRQAKLNNVHGLFKVTEGIYQLRGFCLANMTIIEGKTGWIIVDTLMTRETASRAIAFARKHLKNRPITAIIFTHSHIDHFGGVLGLITPEEAQKRKVRVIAPKGFMEEATSENVLAGVAMARRAEYMYGRYLAPSKQGHVDNGLGKKTPFGNFGLMEPTEIVDRTPQKMVIDGIRFIFQYAPESEAPAELTFYLPEKKTFCGAEVVSHNMHNLYTLRGAKVRDALQWSNYINQAIHLFGDAEIYFGCHQWPIWGNERVMAFMKKQRDLYKYIHDQTLRLANSGYTPIEIAEQIELPETLRNSFSNRGYYGTLSHNAKAVYQAYFGWYDANPANLNPLPPKDSAIRYVEFMGGADALLEKAAKSFQKGEYRWVAEVLNHLVFADPGNEKARALLARTYDQLGYQSESGPWRNVYLTAAYELRHGSPEQGLNLQDILDILKLTPIPRFFDSMAVRLNGPKAAEKDFTINIVLTDTNESYVLTVENGVLHHRRSAPAPEANATVKITHDLFLRMLVGLAGIKETIFSEDLETSGSRIDLVRFLLLFDKPQSNFNIVTP